MDLWTYLKSFQRWWWIVIAVPAVAFVLAVFVVVPPAKWQTSWESTIIFPGNPAASNSFEYVDFIVLDDMAHLLRTDILGDRVYAALPDEITSRYSREQIGEMYSAFRSSRFVEITVSGDDPDVVNAVARTTEEVLPESVNEFLIPADSTAYPSEVTTMTPIPEPVLQSSERWLDIGVMTVAAVLVSLCLVGLAEWLRLSYRAKYGAR